MAAHECQPVVMSAYRDEAAGRDEEDEAAAEGLEGGFFGARWDT